MRASRCLVSRTVLPIAAAIVVFGCASNPGAPSSADVKTAFQVTANAGNAAYNTTPLTYTYSASGTSYTASGKSTQSSGGSIALSVDCPATNASPLVTNGTIVFTNWIDSGSGYTINGTLNFSGTTSYTATTIYPMTTALTLTGALTLKGGPDLLDRFRHCRDGLSELGYLVLGGLQRNGDGGRQLRVQRLAALGKTARSRSLVGSRHPLESTSPDGANGGRSGLERMPRWLTAGGVARSDGVR